MPGTIASTRAVVASRLAARFGGDVDRVALSTPGGITDEALTALVTETRTTFDHTAPRGARNARPT